MTEVAAASKIALHELPDWPRLMSRVTAAKYLDVSEWTVDNLRRAKTISYLPGTKLFDRKALDMKLDELSGLSNATTKKSRWGERINGDGQSEL